MHPSYIHTYIYTIKALLQCSYKCHVTKCYNHDVQVQQTNLAISTFLSINRSCPATVVVALSDIMSKVQETNLANSFE